MQNYQVLIIDDDLSFTNLVKIRLEQILKNISIQNFASLASAEKFLKKANPNFDLVVIDQHLPDGLGSDFIKKGLFGSTAVLSMSSDQAIEIPAKSIGAGATFFLQKDDLSKPLFEYLIHGLIQRNQIAKELNETNKKLVKLDTIKKLISTFKHEINNPLTAIFGASFILKRKYEHEKEQMEAIQLIDTSSKRIKEIIESIDRNPDLTEENKANQNVYQIPGDKPWK